MSRTSKRKKHPPKLEEPLQNCFTALQTEEEGPIVAGDRLKEEVR